MTIDNYVKKINISISEKNSYEEYVEVFYEYIEFLKKILADNPCNIKAVCQLAIAYMETRESAEKSIELMEEALNNFENVLNVYELAELLTNLAYFYENELYEFEKAKYLLERAVTFEPDLPNSYNALAVIYLNEGNVKEALRLFSKAIFLNDDIKYHYNYAVALYQDGQIEQALQIFYEISNEWRCNEISERAYYSYGMIKGILGDIEVGYDVVNNMFSMVEPAIAVDAQMLGDLFFVCKEYEKSIEMYEYEKLHPYLEWVSFYLYSYYKTRSKEQCIKVFNEIIASVENEIQEEQMDKDEEWTKEERKVYLNDRKNEIKDFTALYDSIINKGFKPKIEFKPELIYGCYLIDCPRHSY